MDHTRKFFRCCEKILLFLCVVCCRYEKDHFNRVSHNNMSTINKSTQRVYVCQTTIQNKKNSTKQKRLDVLLLMHTQTRMLYEHRTVCGGW
jgi:hypothetical protein